MKKVPKRFRKKYSNGTDTDGIQQLDANGQPLPAASVTPDINGKPKDTRNLGSKIGGSMGWLQFANGAQTAVRGANDANNLQTETDPVTGKTYTKYKTQEAGAVNAWTTPLHEKVLKSVGQGDYGKATKQIFSGGIQDAIDLKKNDKQFDAQKGIIKQHQIDTTNTSLADMIAKRNRGETGVSQFNPTTNFQYQSGMAKGGEVKGKGTGTSDSINAEVEKGSFIVPSKNSEIAERIRATVLKKKTGKADLHKGSVPIKISAGEHVFTENEKNKIEEELGEDFLKSLAPDAEEGNEKAQGGELSAEKAKIMLKDNQANGQPLSDKQKRYFGWIAGGRKMATGGDVIDESEGEPNKIGSKTPPKETKPVTKVPAKKYSNKKPFIPRETIPSKPAGNFFSDMINKQAEQSLTTASNKIDSTPLADNPRQPATQKPNFWDKVGNTDFGGIGTNLMNYGLSAYQIQQGLKGLKGSKRPIATLDPTFNNDVNTAHANAKFGYTPEQQAMLDQQNQTLLNAGRFAARNYSGGSGGNAFNMERNAINDSFTRSLENASNNTQLQQSKQQYATGLAAQRAGMSRQIFEDALGAFNAKQMASADTLNAGIGNAFQANRYANFMKLRGQENDFNSKYNP